MGPIYINAKNSLIDSQFFRNAHRNSTIELYIHSNYIESNALHAHTHTRKAKIEKVQMPYTNLWLLAYFVE